MIKIGETHGLFSFGDQRWDGEDTADSDATEAVKRLVEAAIAVGDAKSDLARHVALITLMEMTAPFRSREYGLEWQVDANAAPFTETEEGR